MNSLAFAPAVPLKAIATQALGCPCQNLSGALDYDLITIAGKQYSANQIVDKTIVASRDVTLYPSLFSDAGKFTVKAGQAIGKVFSFLLPSSKSNPTGKVVLQFEREYNKYYWLKDDNAISVPALRDQGTVTLKDELAQEAEEEKRQNDPISYYIEKYGFKVLLIGGAIYLAATFGKEFLKNKMQLSGVPNESILSMTKDLNKLKAQRNKAKKGSKKRAVLIEKIDQQAEKIINAGGPNLKPKYAQNYDV